MNRLVKMIGCLLLAFSLQAQSNIELYPTNWFVGMKWNKVQVIVRNKENVFSNATIRLNYPGVQLTKVHAFENKKYLALDLLVSPSAKPGKINIQLTSAASAAVLTWELKPRRTGMGKTFANGVSAKDFIYLLMPDRFSNGNPSNDVVSGYKDNLVNRKDPIKRHGGDLEGVANNLDYLHDMGVTAIWMTPVLENDMPLQSEQAGMMAGYHGYWFTNHYAIDKRLGGENAYKKLIDAAHAKGIKIIQDAVYNHVGNEHWMFKDAPAKDWINHWPTYTNTNHRDEAIFDPMGNAADKKVMLDGWFVPHLPDINQRNPYVANFLIQHALWTVEEFGIDGWRVDTYKYCDEQFMNNVNSALEKDFPTISIFGEAVANTVAGSAYFTKNNMQPAFKHNAPGTTDFPLSYAMMDAINKPFGWTEGVNKLYMTLSQDLLYQAPEKNCIFLDNHDMERFVSMIGSDMNKYKMGMNLLLTLRGIPQLYYGTELWMKNFKDPNDGMVRLDFPGGFPNDEKDKRVTSGRDQTENNAFNYVKALANFRKSNTALQTGKMMQWLPNDGLYVYFRYDQGSTIMVVLNTSAKEKTVSFTNYSERTNGFKAFTDVITGQKGGTTIQLAPMDSRVVLLTR
jgi:neopullulanase